MGQAQNYRCSHCGAMKWAKNEPCNNAACPGPKVRTWYRRGARSGGRWGTGAISLSSPHGLHSPREVTPYVLRGAVWVRKEKQAVTQNGKMTRREIGLAASHSIQEEADEDARKLLKKVGSWEKLTKEAVGTNYYVTRQRIRALQAETELATLKQRLSQGPDNLVATYESERQSLLKTIEELTETNDQKDKRITELEGLVVFADQDNVHVAALQDRIKDLEQDIKRLEAENTTLKTTTKVVRDGYSAEQVTELMLQMSKRNAELEQKLLQLVMRPNS